MLIYLFFIFTCSWCICWLIFLSYQANTSRQNSSNARARLLGSQSWAKRYQVQHSTPASRQSEKVEFLTNIDGSHSIPRRNHSVDLEKNLSEDSAIECPYDAAFDEQLQYGCEFKEAEEDCDDSILLGEPELRKVEDSGGLDYYCERCHFLMGDKTTPTTTNDSSQRRPEESSEMRGWPDELWSLESDGEEQMDLSKASIWPIVELHENPLNSISIRRQTTMQRVVRCETEAQNELRGCEGGKNSTDASDDHLFESSIGDGDVRGLRCCDDDNNINYDEDQEDPSLTLDRSRLLSLSEANQDKRAAIRMVSKASGNQCRRQQPTQRASRVRGGL